MRTREFAIAAAALLLAAVALAACAGPQSGSPAHPEKVEGAPICSSCHDAQRAALDHNADWMRAHGEAAVSERRACDLCHRASTCADCHGAKEEMRPSEKRKLRPGSDTPHRGDYLTQHRIDGRLNPASCFGCHGRKNEWRCQECHR